MLSCIKNNFRIQWQQKPAEISRNIKHTGLAFLLMRIWDMKSKSTVRFNM